MEFITIKCDIETEIVVKKSKFIAHLFYIESTDKAEKLLNGIKKKYHDARHNCMAYRILDDNNQIIEKSSDDGEPAGTAGTPMLAILQKNQLMNVMIIVTRYFGGILLGTGGLVRAYSDSLLKAIEKTEKVVKCQGIEMLVTIEYNQFDVFQHYCKNNQILITNAEYLELVVCKIELEEEKKSKLLKDFETKKVNIKDLKELTKKYITKSI